MKTIIENIIKELATTNYNQYSSDYTAQNANYACSELAKSYWDTRDESEVERDEKAGVTVEDYESWCIEAVSYKIEENA